MSIIIIGDAFIDVIVPIYGVKPGETHHRNILVSCGGTANVAVQVAGLGEQAKFLGIVGNDALGLYFVENLNKHDVSALISFDDDHPTGLCVSLAYDDGERTMVASRGANDYLTGEMINSYLDQIVESEIAYFSGYSLLHNSEVILDAMGRCRDRCEIWFNPGAPNIITGAFKEVVNGLVDGLILNLDEAKAMTEKDKIEDVMAELAWMADLSVVSLGKDGCIVSGGKGTTRVASSEVITSVDTTGAGDAFSAGFIVGRLQGMDEVQCAKLGHQAAANFLRQKGQANL